MATFEVMCLYSYSSRLKSRAISMHFKRKRTVVKECPTKSGNTQLAQLMAGGALIFFSCGVDDAIHESYLEYSDVSAFGGNQTSNTPPYFSKVKLTEGGYGVGVDVDVDMQADLFAPFRFVDSGNDSNYVSFAFKPAVPDIAHVTQIAPSPWSMNAVNPLANNPFGYVRAGLDCCAQNGAAGALADPLNFHVNSDHDITFQRAGEPFTSNSSGTFGPYNGGWLFSADDLGPNGITGSMAAADLARNIPEPATYTMLLTSLSIIAFKRRRRKRSEVKAAE